MKKILIVKLSAIGDICHTLFVLPALQRSFPKAKITWLIEEKCAKVLTLFSEESRAKPYREGGLKIITVNLDRPISNWSKNIKSIKNLRQEKYDLAIDFQGLLKSSLLARLSGAKKIWGFSAPTALEGSHFLYHHRLDKAVELKRLNVSEKNRLLVKAVVEGCGSCGDGVVEVKDFGLERPSLSSNALELLEEKDKDNVERWMDGKQGPLIALSPWASFNTKTLPESVVASLVVAIEAEFKVKPVLIYSPVEQDLAEAWAKKYPLTLAPLVSLVGLFVLLKKFDFFVGMDSGPSYISQLVGTSTLVLFGPTNLVRQFPLIDLPVDSSSAKNISKYFSQGIYSKYDCPIIRPSPITKPYRCLNKNCQDNLCMKKFQELEEVKYILECIKTNLINSKKAIKP